MRPCLKIVVIISPTLTRRSIGGAKRAARPGWAETPPMVWAGALSAAEANGNLAENLAVQPDVELSIAGIDVQERQIRREGLQAGPPSQARKDRRRVRPERHRLAAVLQQDGALRQHRIELCAGRGEGSRVIPLDRRR